MEQNIIKENIEEVLSSAFLEYAGYNLQRRAIPDVRDGLKWGARQLLHAQMLGKFTYNKPFKKAIKSVSQVMGFSYVHGDASAYGTFIRMAKPFVMNVPLQEVKGNYGTLIDPDDHSASRYVEMRGSEAASFLLKDLEKDTITEWEDTYDLEGQFPKVLPAKGFWGLINGCISIGSGMSCSIPPLNLQEANEALIKLLWNPNISEEELIVFPDFPTGATILNKDAVFESLKNGTGSACRIRASVEWDSEERCFIVKELPYSTYTNTICKELATIMDENPELGIVDFTDYTGTAPDLRIYLNKRANPDKVLKFLYKNTSLENHFSINMVVLESGLSPKVMGQKEMFQAHLNHEKEIYIRGFYFDLDKINGRLRIIEALLKAYDVIDEVIQTIKTSISAQTANFALQKLLAIEEDQAKAILELKLAKLSKLDVSKLISEQQDLEKEKEKIEKILASDELLKREIEAGLQEVAKKFGNSRKTQILNLDIDKESDEPIEKKNLIIHLTNKGNLYTFENSTLMSQKRGGRGTNLKLDNNESIIDTITCVNDNNCLVLSNKGKAYALDVTELPIGQKCNVNSMFEFEDNEKVNIVFPFNKINERNYAVFATKNGLVKKTSLEEYRLKRGKAKGVIAIKLKDNDELVSVSVIERNSSFGFLTKDGNSVIINIDSVSNTGRATSGVIGIKLSEGDEVVDAKPIKSNTKQIISLSSRGNTKKTDYDNFCIGNRATKGVILQKTKEDDYMIGFNTIEENDKEIAFVSNKGIIRVSLDDIPLLGRATFGCKAKQLKDNEFMLSVLKVV